MKDLTGRPVPGLITVKNLHDSGPGSLRTAVQYANSHAKTTINFAHRLHGTIKLTTGELAITQSMKIDGPGAHRLAVSGTHRSRVLRIGPGATVTISGLTVTCGLADDTAPDVHSLGGGILNRGDLTLKHTVVSHNQAAGAAGDTISLCGYPVTGAGIGGGVANLHTLTVSHSRVEENLARGASGSSDSTAVAKNTLPGVAIGGGLANMGKATAAVTKCWFTGNLARAGNGCDGTYSPTGLDIAGDAGGGAIASFGTLNVSTDTAKLEVSHSHFSNNRAIGGNDNRSPVLPGHSFGGAIASHKFKGIAVLKVSRCTFDHNEAIGGDRNVVTTTSAANERAFPNMAAAGGLFACGTATISDSTFSNNEARGGLGVDPASTGLPGTAVDPITVNGGDGRGGGIGFAFAGTVVTVSHCRVKGNSATGGLAGPGGSGGNGWCGGVGITHKGPTLTLNGGSIIDDNQAQGGGGDASGPPSNGGEGLGGGVYINSSSTATLTLSSITQNRATGGKGENGGIEGDGIGGGLYYQGKTTFNPKTITQNHASTSNDDVYP